MSFRDIFSFSMNMAKNTLNNMLRDPAILATSTCVVEDKGGRTSRGMNHGRVGECKMGLD